MDHQRNIITPAARKFVFSRRLPKTGQLVSYAGGDDGDYEAGWDMGQRFIESTVGGEDLVFDRATGLQWGKDWNDGGGNNGANATWANAIIAAEASAWAGFTDWRLPNLYEYYSIHSFDIALAPGPLIGPPFLNVAFSYWTSTTDPYNVLQAFYVAPALGSCAGFLKTNAIGVALVRRGL